jgi:hypothetical protein
MSDIGHAQKCVGCGTQVRDDVVNHGAFCPAVGRPNAAAPKLAASPASN